MKNKSTMNVQTVFLILPVLFIFILNVVGVEKREDKIPDNAEKIKGIAVVKGKYDKIDRLLSIYRIPYTKIDYSNLEDKSIFNKYRAVFFPCGIGNPVETNVNILSRGSKIHTVSLKEDFYEIDKDKIAENIRSFIENGGYAYFSDYSYEFIDRAFDNFHFFRNFPNMGRRGRINLELKDDLSSFCRKRYESLYMPHNGWIAAKSIADADIFAYASFETIDGPNFGPVIARMHIGEGELLYTSYHKNTANQISRFIIYRVTHSHLLKDLMSRAAIWNHKINASIIDSIKRWERYRSYIIPLKKGMNTIYFLSDMDAFQIDIFDKENNLVASKDWSNNRFILDIEIEFQDFYILKVYPSQNKGRGVYSIISTSGQRIFPYYKATLYALLFLLIAFLLFWIRRNFNKRGSDILLNYE